MSFRFRIYWISITLIIVGLLILAATVKRRGDQEIAIEAESARPNSEAFWQEILHEELGGVMEYRLEDNTRVDILTPTRAIEVDWQTKWAEGIGQSMHYGYMTNRPPLVILLATDQSWDRYSERVEHCGIECWVFDTTTRKWLKGGEKQRLVVD